MVKSEHISSFNPNDNNCPTVCPVCLWSLPRNKKSLPGVSFCPSVSLLLLFPAFAFLSPAKNEITPVSYRAVRAPLPGSRSSNPGLGSDETPLLHWKNLLPCYPAESSRGFCLKTDPCVPVSSAFNAIFCMSVEQQRPLTDWRVNESRECPVTDDSLHTEN